MWLSFNPSLEIVGVPRGVSLYANAMLSRRFQRILLFSYDLLLYFKSDVNNKRKLWGVEWAIEDFWMCINGKQL